MISKQFVRTCYPDICRLFLEINAEKALVDFEVHESDLGLFKRNQDSSDILLYDQKSKLTSVLTNSFKNQTF